MKYTHNRNFFRPLTNSNCYWAGFLAADGYVCAKNGALILTLSEKDSLHVQKFKIAIDATNPIHFYNTSNGYKSVNISIHSAYECLKDLENRFNIIQAKSLILKPPLLVQEDHVRNFIRGYMDGDGSISHCQSGRQNYWTLSFIGTQEMLSWIKSQIKAFVFEIGNPSVLPDRNMYQLIFGYEQIKKILQWLYKDSTSETRLERKYMKYLEACEFYKNLRQYASQYKGVAFVKRTNRWTAEIKQNGQRFHLGYFKTEKDAALAYNQKAQALGLIERCYQV